MNYCYPWARPLTIGQVTVPLVYDESLSVAQQIACMFGYIKRLCEAENDHAAIAQLEMLYDWIVKDQVRQDNRLKDYVDDADDNLRDEILRWIKKIEAGMIEVVNPTSNVREYVGDVIDDLYEWLRYFGLTSAEFEVQGYTAEELDGFGLTAREKDTGNHAYIKRRRFWRGYSPVDGVYSDPQRVYLTLQQEVSLKWDCSDFDGMGDDANALDGREWTAHYWDWYGIGEPTEYELPIASATQLGGIKVGANLEIEADGTLNAISSGGGTGTSYTAGDGLGLTGTEFFLRNAGKGVFGGVTFAVDDDFMEYMGL